MSASQRRQDLIARVFAIKRLYFLVHRAIRRVATGPVSWWAAAARGFASRDPNQWPNGELEILGQHVIRALAPTLVYFGCRRVNPPAIEVEGFQQPRLVEEHVGLDLLQGAFADEKRRFQGTVVPRKADGMNGLIVEAAFVGKA
jgi:hypothetical protein